MLETDFHPTRSGRPRNPQADGDIIEAVLNLVSEGATLSGLSLVAIAKRAGVSRNSLYRRWKNKDDLYLDVLGSINRPIPKKFSGEIRADLARFLSVLAERVLDPRASRMLRALNAEAGNYPDLHRRYHQEIVAPRRQILKAIIERGIFSGAIRHEVDVNMLADLLVSPILSRMASSTVGDLDPEITSRLIVDLALDGAAMRSTEYTATRDDDAACAPNAASERTTY